MREINKTTASCLASWDVPVVPIGATVADAINLMRTSRSAAVVVQDEGRNAIGIFTDRDLLHRVAAEGLDVHDISVESVMTPNPRTLGPADCISYAINRMAVGGYTNIPIQDDEGELMGLLTVRDVVAHLADVFQQLQEPHFEDEHMADWVDIGGGG